MFERALRTLERLSCPVTVSGFRRSGSARSRAVAVPVNLAVEVQVKDKRQGVERLMCNLSGYHGQSAARAGEVLEI